MSQVRALGIIDWGIGGLDFYRQLRALGPTSIRYLSDAGFTPYGKLSHQELRSRLHSAILFLKDQGATHVVVACNAASTALNTDASLLDSDFALPCMGVIAPTIAAIVKSAAHHPMREVLILGGKRTIESNQYGQGLKGLQALCHQRVAQPLSAFVERGFLTGPEVTEAIVAILDGLPQHIDALVLACTHYTALLPQFEALLTFSQLFDPAKETLAHMRATWGEVADADDERFFSTGDPRSMAQAAKLAFGIDLPKITQVSLDLSTAIPNESRTN